MTYFYEAEKQWQFTLEKASDELQLVDIPADFKLLAGKPAALDRSFKWLSFSDVQQSTDELKACGRLVVENTDGFQFELTLFSDANNDFWLKSKVTGNFPRTRTSAETESDEEKARLDDEFAKKLAGKDVILADLDHFSSWVYKIDREKGNLWTGHQQSFLEPLEKETTAVDSSEIRATTEESAKSE